VSAKIHPERLCGSNRRRSALNRSTNRSLALKGRGVAGGDARTHPVRRDALRDVRGGPRAPGIPMLSSRRRCSGAASRQTSGPVAEVRPGLQRVIR